MNNRKRILGLIPARSGSKGIPDKNVTSLGGYPLLAWSIRAAIKSRLLDRVVVSTDSREIADISVEYGADVPFIRPAELSTDEASGVDVVLHACEQLSEYSTVVVLQPTSPLRTVSDIDASIRLQSQPDVDFCVSVTMPKHHPNWMLYQPDDGYASRYTTETIAKRRQDLKTLYALNGAVYVADTSALRTEQTLFGTRTVTHVMPPERSIDIDTRTDLQICRALIDQGGIEPFQDRV